MYIKKAVDQKSKQYNEYIKKKQATEIGAVQILLREMKVQENKSENSETNKTNKQYKQTTTLITQYMPIGIE